jgi:hypothetical protein
LTGAFVGGVAADWVPVYVSRRRKGFFKPEFRLLCLIPTLILAPVGFLLWGFGFGKQLSPYMAIVGTGIFYHVLCAASSITKIYIVDCYRPITGEAIILIQAFRNTFAFGLTFGIFPWIERNGTEAVSLTPVPAFEWYRIALTSACVCSRSRDI